jgi:competence protein ComEA
MPELDPRRLAAGAAAALVLVLLAAWYVSRPRTPAQAAAPPAAAISVSDGGGDGGRVVVDVAGAVRRPGVYRLSSSARVEDALRRAGGATHRADLSQVNRAAKLEDGRQILVPTRASASLAAGGASAAPGAGAAATPSVPLDLNTATLEQLETLDGVGPATAQKILDYRTAHNGFGSVDELDQVPGIGPKRLAALRAHLRV